MKKVIILLLLVFLSSCSVNRMVMNKVADFMDDGTIVLYQEDDLGLAEHFLANNLKTLEVLLAKDPQNQRLNFIASQGFGAYAMGFVEDYDPARASKLYLRGVNYGIRALPKKKKFTKKTPPKKLEKILQKYTKEEVPALFWTGYNWGLYTMQNLDKTENLLNLAKVELIMRRCFELDESYYFYSVDLFYGAYYAGRPRILGGNPEKGKEFFINNITKNKNKILLGKLFYAQYYAIQNYDEKLFDKLIDEILNFDLEQNPHLRLLNAISQKKAKNLKEKKELYF